MLMFEGPVQRPSWGLHAVEGYSVGPAEGNYRCYKGWTPATGSERISDTVVFFPPRKYTYDLPAPPTQEEVVQEAARALGDSLRTMATNNPTYTHLTQFSGLQQLLDLVNSAAKKAAEAKSKERQKMATPNSPGRQRVGPHIIEEDHENAEQKLQ